MEGNEMPQMMYFGYACSGCKRPERLGKIEIEPNAPPSKLHELLELQGWKPETSVCSREKCKSATYVPIEKTILLGPVVTTPDGIGIS
jgi:hypothetical protein